MAEIQFEEEQAYQPGYQQQRMGQKPFMVRLVLATKIVSTDEAANYVLLGIALIAFALSIYFLIPNSPPKRVGNPLTVGTAPASLAGRVLYSAIA